MNADVNSLPEVTNLVAADLVVVYQQQGSNYIACKMTYENFMLQIATSITNTSNFPFVNGLQLTNIPTSPQGVAGVVYQDPADNNALKLSPAQ